jgi:hypothetical protein
MTVFQTGVESWRELATVSDEGWGASEKLALSYLAFFFFFLPPAEKEKLALSYLAFFFFFLPPAEKLYI